MLERTFLAEGYEVEAAADGGAALAAVERSTATSASAPRAQATAAPVSAFSLLWHLIKLRVGRLFGRT